MPILPVVCLGNERLHPWAKKLEFIARRLKMPFFRLSLGILAFILFPSLEVWGMKTRLHYHIQPIYKLNIEEEKQVRSYFYQEVQRLQEKLQCILNQLIHRS